MTVRAQTLCWATGVLAAFLLDLGLGSARAQAGGEAERRPDQILLEGTLLDATTGRPVAARLTARDEYGRIVEIDGKHSHVDYLGQRWCYADGSFRVSLPAGGLKVQIRRGLETLPLEAQIASPAEGVVKRAFRLHRWVDMRARGYVNGDIHAHIPLPDEAHRQMRAEDLNVLNLLAGEGNSVTPYFTGSLDTRSTPGCEIRVCQEVRDWQMGHLTLLGLSQMIPGYPHVGGTLERWVRPHWLMAYAMEKTREQKGHVAWSHFSNLPGAESPIAIALGLIDIIELMTYDDPTQLPSHWGPWKNSGMPMAEFTVMRGMDLYYQYLNAGFRVPIAAGTDKMDADIPLGSNRTYVPTKGGTDYAGWLNGLLAGRGFITNGPMLDFTVDGHVAGDTVDIQSPRMVKARVSARSILPFTTLEIVRNGEVVGHKTVFVEDNPPVDGVRTLEVEASVPVDRSSWLAARVAEDPDIKSRILPRGLSVFAHTNPVYFTRAGAPVREEPSIRYLEKYIRGTIHWLQTNPTFTNPADRDEALKRAHKALAALRSTR